MVFVLCMANNDSHIVSGYCVMDATVDARSHSLVCRIFDGIFLRVLFYSVLDFNCEIRSIYNIVYLYLSTLRCSQNKSDFVTFYPFFLHIFYLSSLFRFFSSFYPFFPFFSSFFSNLFFVFDFPTLYFPYTSANESKCFFFLARKNSLRLKSILIPSIHYVHLHLDVLLSCNSHSFCYQIRESLAYALFKSKKHQAISMEMMTMRTNAKQMHCYWIRRNPKAMIEQTVCANCQNAMHIRCSAVCSNVVWHPI